MVIHSQYLSDPSPHVFSVLSPPGCWACSDRETWCVVISGTLQRAEESYLEPLEESWGTRWGPTGLIKTRRARDGTALHFTRERANASVCGVRLSTHSPQCACKRGPPVGVRDVIVVR